MNQVVEIPEDGLPLTHTFSNGVYAREIFMPAGMLVVGHLHKTRHLNIVSTGSAYVWMGGEIVHIKAPYTFESDCNIRKVLFILEDMFWTTIHVTDETDIEKITDSTVDINASLGFDIENIIEQFNSIGGKLQCHGY